MTESNRQLAGRRRKRQNLPYFETFADLLLDAVLVKTSLGVQLDPSYAPPDPTEAVINLFTFNL